MDEEKEIAGRRDFLKMATLGTLGSLILPACSNSSAAADPGAKKTITVLGIVDIGQSLADNSLTNNMYWFDNNSGSGSRFQGTDHLCTAINRGNFIQWFVYGLQVETFAEIGSITGSVVTIANPVLTPVMPGIAFWYGQIASYAAGGIYQYALTLNVEDRLMAMPSLLTLEVQ